MIFMCFYVWVLVLVDVFDVWVYSFYNGGYLSGENLGVFAFYCEIDCEYNFIEFIWS